MLFLDKKIYIEEKRINTIKIQPKPKLVTDIKIFIRFVNFYQYFISSFNKITDLFILILKTILQLINTLLQISIDNSKVVNSIRRNNKNLAKSIKLNFIKAIYKVKKSSFLTPDTR